MNDQKKPLTIVCVDDDEQMRTLMPVYIRYCLCEREIDLITGSSRAELTSRVEQSKPHIIITDNDMEEKDAGVRGIMDIRSKYDTPIILMSGHFNGAREKLREISEVYYLDKPFKLPKFEEVLRTAYPRLFSPR